MAARDKERFYWIKLNKDFFKRHDIAVIESMQNGKDYVLFYLKLMLESVDHNGRLRFSEMIPYDVDMLSAVTRTNVDIVRSAMRILCELGMIEILDDKTIFCTEVGRLLGSETFAAQRKREERALPPADNGGQCPQLSPECPLDIEIDIEKDIDIELKENNKASQPSRKKFIPPTIEEVEAYCRERKNNVDAAKFIDHYTAVGWKIGKNPMKDWRASVRTWERNAYGNQRDNQQHQNNASRFDIVYD